MWNIFKKKDLPAGIIALERFLRTKKLKLKNHFGRLDGIFTYQNRRIQYIIKYSDYEGECYASVALWNKRNEIFLTKKEQCFLLSRVYDFLHLPYEEWKETLAQEKITALNLRSLLI